MLTQEEINEIFEYDDIVGQLRWRVNFSKKKIGQIAGFVGNRGYRRIYYNYRFYNAQRLIWILHYGYIPDQIDHINHDRDDNHISNLRDVNASLNQQNQKPSKKPGSSIPGVYYDSRIKRYRVRLYINKKMVNFGTFIDKDIAEQHGLEMRRLYYPGNTL